MSLMLLLQSVPWAGIKWLDTAVLWLLIIIALLIAIIIIVNCRKFTIAKKASKLYVEEVAKLLLYNKWNEALKLSSDFSKRTHMARVVLAGMEERDALLKAKLQESLVSKHMSQAMERCILVVKYEYKWGLGIMDAIGSTAPFIGALGGSALTFALGIILAIPTIWFATHFRNRIEMFESEMESAKLDVTSHLEKQIV